MTESERHVSDPPTQSTHAADNTDCNANYPWSKFDPEAYFEHYYGDPHPDDDRVTQCATAALETAYPANAKLDVVDVGTGPNLIPFFSAFSRARRLTAWEYAQTNIEWIERELSKDTLRPQWQHFWDIARASAFNPESLPQNPLPAMRQMTSIVKGSIFDLPKANWDAATMFFCAESITGRRDEFEAACNAFASCVRSGGTLAAAFLVRSSGYEVGGRRFPAINLSVEDIEAVFRRLASDVRIEPVGLVSQEVRSGYSGALFLTARAP